MKKLLFTLFTLSAFVAFSQAPNGISYQGIARNTGGTVLASQAIAIKFELHQGSAAGSIVFNETHNVTTNAFGLFNLTIGSVNTSGFATINWGGGPYFLETSLDPTGGASFSSLGTQQFMSVPYALYAQTSGNASPTPTITINAPNTVSGSAGSYNITVPAQTLSINSNSISISNGNTITLPTPAVYTAGTGINVAGTTISNTAPDQTVTLTPAGSATVTGSYPNFTINTPTVQTYSAGNGIDITGGVISNTAAAVTPTIIGTGATNVSSSGNTFTVNTPAQTVYTAGNGIDVTGSVITGTANIVGTGATTVTGTYPNLTINSPTTQVYSAGTGIDISTTGVITNTAATAVTPTITGTNLAVVTPTTGNVFNVDVPQPSLSYNNTGNILTLTQGAATTSVALIGTGSSTINMAGAGIANVSPTSGSAFTVTVPSPTFTPSGPTTITGSYPNYTINSPVATASTSLVQGSNVTLNQSGSTYTVSSVTPTLTVNGGLLTGSYPTQTLTIPAGTLTTLTQSTNVTVSGSAPNYTVSSVTPTLNVIGGSISGAYPSQTITIPASTLTTLTQSTNVTVSGSAPNYTVSSVTPTLNVIGGSLTGAYPSQTLTIPASTAYVGTAGNVTVTSNTINLAATGVTAGTYGANATNAVPTFSVDNFGRLTTASQYTPNVAGDVIGSINTSTVSKIRGVNVSATAPTVNQVLQFTGGNWTPSTLTSSTTVLTQSTGIVLTGSAPNYTISAPAPALSLSGSTLTSGAPTNSVDLSSLSVWSSSVGVLYPTTVTNSVGIGTSGPLTDKVEINYASSTANTHLHLRQGGADAFSRIKFTNSVAPTKYWLNTVTSAATDANSGYNFYYHNGTTGNNIFTVAGDGKVSVNPFGTLNSAWLYVGGRVRIDSSLTMAAYNTPPATSLANEGRIYYDRPTNKFYVSENAGAYKPLFSASPWVQGTGIITQTNTGDNVGIGTATPNAFLDVENNGTLDGVQVNMNNASNGSNGLQVTHFGAGSAGYFQINNASSNGRALTASTNGTGRVIEAIHNGTSNEAGYFLINNTSNANNVIYAKTTGGGAVINADNFGTGRAIEAKNYAGNTQAVIFAQSGGTGPAGFFEVFNPSTNSNAIAAAAYGSGATILGNNFGSGNAGSFAVSNATSTANALQVSTNGMGTAVYVTNSNSSNSSAALQVDQVSTGVAIYAKNSNSTSGSVAQLDGFNGSTTFNAINYSSGSAINANAQAGSALYAQNTGGTSPTIYASNSGTGDVAQLYGGANGQRAIYASNNSPSYATIEAINAGTGPVFSGSKNTGATGGNVASFTNSSSTNAADALFASNAGAGAAIHATSAATSTLGLWVQGGHLKSTQTTAPTTSSISVSGGGLTAVVPSLSNASDVKGKLTAVITTTTLVNPGNTTTIRVTFNKGYSIVPAVVVTPLTDLLGMSYFVTNVTTTTFDLTVKNSTTGSITTPGTWTVNFNYMVIE